MPKKKTDQPGLRFRYEYREKKRATADGLVSEALSGDREMIQQLASYGALIMHDRWEEQDNFAEFADSLSYVLGKIAEGVEPNIAFGWHKTSEWSKQRESFATLRKNYALASTTHSFVTNLVGQSASHAYEFTAGIYRMSSNDIREKLTSLTGIEERLSTDLAKKVAIEIVATYGAWKYHASEDSVLRAYNDYLRQE